MFPPGEISTPRLRLVPVAPAIVRAFHSDRQVLSRLLSASIPANWPVDPIILEILNKHLDEPSAFEWADYIYIHKKDGKVVGDGGFKGPPDADGRVEIGYAIVPEYRTKGLATEGAQALLTRAFAQPGVATVCADTSVNGLASMRILQKLGMHICGKRHNAADGDLICWQLTRDDYENNLRKP